MRHHCYLLTLPLLILPGCLNRSSSLGKGPVQPNPQPQLASDVTVRVNRLSDMIGHFDASAAPLPTNSDADLRKVMNDVFADLSQILPTLYGPDENGGYRQQRRIVDNTRTQLQNMPASLSPDPVIDAGLRAAYNALAGLQRDQFYDRKDIGKSLDTYRARLDALDAVRGPLHRGAVADAVHALSRVLHQMADTLAARLHEQRASQAAGRQSPATQPAHRRT